jgi:hypothetical protein
MLLRTLRARAARGKMRALAILARARNFAENAMSASLLLRGFCWVAAGSVLMVPNFARADAKADIAASYQKMLKARSRAETTLTDDKGKVTHSTTEFDTLQRIHAKSDHGEFVVLPDGMWMKMGAQWSKPPVDMSGMVKQFVPLGEEVLRSSKNVADDGATTWQGQSAHAYSYDTDMSVMGMHVTGHTKLYLNAAGQVIGSETDSVAMGHKTHAVQSISYDDSIRVNAPQ